MDNSKKRSPWQIANATVLLLHLVLPVCLDVHTRHFQHSASGDDDLRTAARGVQQAGQKVSEGEGVADRIQGAGSFRHYSILYAPGGAAERQGGSAAVPPQALSVYIRCVWRWKKRHI